MAHVVTTGAGITDTVITDVITDTVITDVITDTVITIRSPLMLSRRVQASLTRRCEVLPGMVGPMPSSRAHWDSACSRGRIRPH
jgi:hypothetical protein